MPLPSTQPRRHALGRSRAPLYAAAFFAYIGVYSAACFPSFDGYRLGIGGTGPDGGKTSTTSVGGASTTTGSGAPTTGAGAAPTTGSGAPTSGAGAAPTTSGGGASSPSGGSGGGAACGGNGAPCTTDTECCSGICNASDQC